MASPSESAQDVPGSDAGCGPDPAIHHHTYHHVPADDADNSHNVVQNPIATSPSHPPAAQVTTSPPYPPSASADTAEAAAVAAARREKGRVRFNSNATASKPPVINFEPPPRVPERSATPSPKLRPSILRANSSGSVATAEDLGINLDATSEKAISAAVAQARAQQVAAKVLRDSPPGSRASMDSLATTAASDGGLLPSDSHIPLRNLAADGTAVDSQPQTPENETDEAALKEEAYDLVRTHTRRFASATANTLPADEEVIVSSANVQPSHVNGGLYDGVYNVPPPKRYRGSVLSQLLKLYKPTEPSLHGAHSRNWSSSSPGAVTPPSLESGTATPTSSRKKWYEVNRSQDTLANLVEASTRLANPNKQAPEPKSPGKKRPGAKRRTSSNRLSGFWQKEEARITVHIAETLSRQGYIIKLCRALMLFGAPTHRLEEYLTMTARVLEIDGQFLYLPGCMLISFDDRSTHTTEVRIVRITQGIDLGKLKDVHHIYKEVMHDVIGVEEGTRRLDELLKAKDKFRAWIRVLVFGLTSATCAPFSFSARLIDLPLAFCFGCLVGLLQLIVTPKSNMYNNVFEVTATIVVSFLARAFGSINEGNLFCFSALAQSGIVMLLPGYSVLCSALELQSRAIVPGSIRIVYAIIYSLLLGFGITVGAALYGLFDNNATSATTCQSPMPSVYTFIFVPFFILCISILYQAKWRQMPVMVLIAFTGYIVNFFSSIKFVASPQIANTLGALSVGILANLYSRLRHGVAAATLIPAIFVQVPGGLASTGGLLSGLSTANQLTNSSTVINGTSTVRFIQGESMNTVVFNVAASMIQIAIGIAVGLFMSAVVIYPLGKRRSGLFSF
ncbi:hypothetical protein MHUMG1_07310 [Metarhizium humberi]|uniref:DUF1212 domain membrane protein Prm10 n=3 Tax=Metarhizium TaxID=5529 RepID=A0A9P8M7L4_9HYPO|nr:DUF1212 domain membrane protein Prm10 [Metarhizium robertsii ARSEF 23]EFZ00761.1 DUF1212 domain membrane protein Prm10 [Metarhizium robertsii ARSEF 23]EXV03278.1 DUF1212 and DUF3815 domain protein [Metarhizium robertsii]KAH0595011.1 hypothetical protein MHUMG1_07310 [Metarhizium humberi]